jgi:membrane-bound ClpP family serine protease
MLSFIIILLIILGATLLLLELLVIPGTTIAGAGGFLLLGSSVYLIYSEYGKTMGYIASIILFILLIAGLYLALRSKTWDKASLKTSIDSSVANTELEKLKPGDIGETISRLAPMGKVIVNNVIAEAKSYNEIINPKEKIEIIKIEQNKLIVKKINL